MRQDSIPESLHYIRELFTPHNPALAYAHQLLQDDRRHGMQLGPEEGKLLQLFIGMAKVKTVVELGTLVGYSTLWMAQALPVDGYIYTIEKSQEHADMAAKVFAQSGMNGRITQLVGDGLAKLQELTPKAPFDMIFIDADKGGYCDYLDWAEANIRQGGVIIGDNTLLFGSVYQEKAPEGVSTKSWQVMREFNRRLADSSRYTSLLIPTSEGMTVAIKKF